MFINFIVLFIITLNFQIVLACLLAVAAAKPGSVAYTAPAVVSAYSAPYAYSNLAGAPLAYSAAAPVAYTNYAHSPLAYSAPLAYTSSAYNSGIVRALPYSTYGTYAY